jgi:oxygen-independent coproporphyrinogen-3 oxidase
MAGARITVVAVAPAGRLLRAMTGDQPRHLYLHVPYCAAKCPYCDFNSIAGRDGEHAAYVDALLTEVRRLPWGPYHTVFIGGGTPTMLGTALLARLLAGVRDHVRLAEGYEWTCEANPGSSDGERFTVLAEHGVNRLSLGVQSTHDHHLRFLGRVHDAHEAERALDQARRSVPRVSADLIMGLPGQTDAELRADLELYRRHDLSHASVYHLTYEPGTEFHARRARGELLDIAPADSRRQFDLLWDTFAGLGLMAYETSNFARAGEESRHNLAYWRQRDYHAAGAGAVSTVDRVRLTRDKHPAAYIAAIMGGGDAAWRREVITPAERLRETWMLGLRLATGVALAEVEAQGDPAVRWRPRLAALVAEGLVEESAGHVRLTRRGRPVQDEVTVYLMP